MQTGPAYSVNYVNAVIDWYCTYILTYNLFGTIIQHYGRRVYIELGESILNCKHREPKQAYMSYNIVPL